MLKKKKTEQNYCNGSNEQIYSYSKIQFRSHDEKHRSREKKKSEAKTKSNEINCKYINFGSVFV